MEWVGTAANHPIGPAFNPYIFVLPFVCHRAAHAHVLSVRVTLYVNTASEYRVAFRCIDESRHDNMDVLYPPHGTFGRPYFRSLEPWNLWIYEISLASFGWLSMGRVPGWIDTQGGTIIYGELVCVWKLKEQRSIISIHQCRRKIPLQDILTCKFHRLRVHGSD